LVGCLLAAENENEIFQTVYGAGTTPTLLFCKSYSFAKMFMCKKDCFSRRSLVSQTALMNVSVIAGDLQYDDDNAGALYFSNKSFSQKFTKMLDVAQCQYYTLYK